MLQRSNRRAGTIATDGRAITMAKAGKAPQQYLSEIKVISSINQNMRDRLGKHGVHQY